MDCYERGFLDALMIAKHYLEKYRDVEKVLASLEDIEGNVTEKRIQRIKEELMIFP